MIKKTKDDEIRFIKEEVKLLNQELVFSYVPSERRELQKAIKNHTLRLSQLTGEKII